MVKSTSEAYLYEDRTEIEGADVSAEWAVRDKLTGEVYPQPNRLIAERVAEMHGTSEVVATQTVTMEYREVKRMQVAPEDIPAFEAGGWRVAEDAADEKIRDALGEILERGNVVYEWPEDEAEAYRSNGGFEAGRDAVRAVRVQKIIDIVRKG